MNKKLEPFVKWAGGKRQLISTLETFYPMDTFTINKYIEPFIGGGSVLFNILNSYCISDISINDINSHLIDTYKVIKNNVKELIKELENIKNIYIPLNTLERNKFYYEMRDKFNELKFKDNITKEEILTKSTLFIFLNKTCFNGLYIEKLKLENLIRQLVSIKRLIFLMMKTYIIYLRNLKILIYILVIIMIC